MTDGNSPKSSTGRRTPARAGVRPVPVPTAPPRRDGSRTPEPNVEIRIADPGFLPVHAVVPADGVTDDLVRRLEALRRDLPRLETGEDTGGVDIRLDTRDSRHLKHGSVVLTGVDGRPHPIAIDATTRRFRLGGLPAGEYKLRAASAGIGSAATSLVVRRGDITRTSVPLVGPAPGGEATLRFVVHGTKRDSLKMRVTDRDSGKVVAEERVVVADGRATLTLAQDDSTSTSSISAPRAATTSMRTTRRSCSCFRRSSWIFGCRFRSPIRPTG
jgi:hypothetical protein